MDKEFSKEEIADINEAWELIANDKMGLDLAIMLSVQNIARFGKDLPIREKLMQMNIWMMGLEQLKNTLDRALPLYKENLDGQEIH